MEVLLGSIICLWIGEQWRNNDCLIYSAHLVKSLLFFKTWTPWRERGAWGPVSCVAWDWQSWYGAWLSCLWCVLSHLRGRCCKMHAILHSTENEKMLSIMLWSAMIPPHFSSPWYWNCFGFIGGLPLLKPVTELLCYFGGCCLFFYS